MSDRVTSLRTSSFPFHTVTAGDLRMDVVDVVVSKWKGLSLEELDASSMSIRETIADFHKRTGGNARDYDLWQRNKPSNLVAVLNGVEDRRPIAFTPSCALGLKAGWLHPSAYHISSAYVPPHALGESENQKWQVIWDGEDIVAVDVFSELCWEKTKQSIKHGYLIRKFPHTAGIRSHLAVASLWGHDSSIEDLAVTRSTTDYEMRTIGKLKFLVFPENTGSYARAVRGGLLARWMRLYPKWAKEMTARFPDLQSAI